MSDSPDRGAAIIRRAMELMRGGMGWSAAIEQARRELTAKP